MAIVVEDGTGKADGEVLISVDDADAYFLARGVTEWTGTDTAKEAALRRGWEWIETRFLGTWKGAKSFTGQALEWPRTGVIDANGEELDGDAIPVRLARANAEAALIFLGGTDPLAPATGGAVKRLMVKAGPVEKETEYEGGATSTRYMAVDRYVLEYLTDAPGQGTGARAIVRA